MMELFTLILSNYLLSRTISREDGPFYVFASLREWAGKKKPVEPIAPPPTDDVENWELYNDDYDQYEKLSKFWKRSLIGTFEGAISCPYCLSWYIAAPMALISTGIQWYSLIIYLSVVGAVNFLLAVEDN